MPIKLTHHDYYVEIQNHLSLEDNILKNVNDAINQFHEESGIIFYDNKYSVYTDWGEILERDIMSDPIDAEIESLEIDITSPGEEADKKLQDMKDYLFDKIKKIDKILIDNQ